jgi:hypothetical protein
MTNEPTNSTATDDEEDAGRGRTRDPELLTLERMLREMRDLDEPARARVVAYLSARFPGGRP